LIHAYNHVKEASNEKMNMVEWPDGHKFVIRVAS
jgi:hypothetical protein